MFFPPAANRTISQTSPLPLHPSSSPETPSTPKRRRERLYRRQKVKGKKKARKCTHTHRVEEVSQSGRRVRHGQPVSQQFGKLAIIDLCVQKPTAPAPLNSSCAAPLSAPPRPPPGGAAVLLKPQVIDFLSVTSLQVSTISLQKQWC